MKKNLILALLMACFAIVACDKEEEGGKKSNITIVSYKMDDIISPTNLDITGTNNVIVEISEISDIKYIKNNAPNDTLSLDINDCSIEYQLFYKENNKADLVYNATRERLKLLGSSTEWQETTVFCLNDLYDNAFYDCYVLTKINYKGNEITLKDLKGGFITTMTEPKFGVNIIDDDGTVEIFYNLDVDGYKFCLEFHYGNQQHNKDYGSMDSTVLQIKFPLSENESSVSFYTLHSGQNINPKAISYGFNTLYPNSNCIIIDNKKFSFTKFGQLSYPILYYYRGLGNIELKTLNEEQLDITKLSYRFTPFAYGFHIVTKDELYFLLNEYNNDIYKIYSITKTETEDISIIEKGISIPFIEDNRIHFLNIKDGQQTISEVPNSISNILTCSVMVN
ncbi:MAG: hypothetical protein MJ211_15865 [Bacteroidales bacterium]|nr:hypothetical protein [Bacteroidales bacterium]